MSILLRYTQLGHLRSKATYAFAKLTYTCDIIYSLLGKDERWRRAGEDREIETLFPFEEYEDLLLNWAVSYMLNQNKYTTPLHQRMQDGDEASTKFQRLYDLIKNNHSYLVFQLLKDLKAELSHSESARLDIPELDIELTLTRAQFETMISSLMAKFEQAIDDTLTRAAIKSSDIELVIRTGGSSLIPAVKRVLEERPIWIRETRTCASRRRATTPRPSPCSACLPWRPRSRWRAAFPT